MDLSFQEIKTVCKFVTWFISYNNFHVNGEFRRFCGCSHCLFVSFTACCCCITIVLCSGCSCCCIAIVFSCFVIVLVTVGGCCCYCITIGFLVLLYWSLLVSTMLLFWFVFCLVVSISCYLLLFIFIKFSIFKGKKNVNVTRGIY